jgi:phospholipid/cholesterol/gamma-HCH transport system substrate-binding protein
MLKYRGKRMVRAGFIGVVLVILVIAIGLQPERLVALATDVRYQAVFTEAGGLGSGNDVMVRGTKVGTVSRVALDRGKALVDFSVDATVPLGSDTTAHVKTGSLLGKRILVLDSSGSATLTPNAIIPVSRTSSPYSLTDAVSELTTNVAATDTNQLNQSLDTLSATLDAIAPQLGPAFDGLTRLSRSLNSRNDSLRDLLATASDVTKILSQRSQQLNTLILNANSLVGMLNDRRQAIVDLLANISAVAKQLSGLVADNEAQLAPTLDRLNSVSAMLEKNRDNIAKALPGLAKSAMTQSEAVSNGSYYNAFIVNLLSPQIIQPFIDSAFNVQPRTLFPFPTCGDDGDCYNREEGPPLTHLFPAPR